MIDHPFIRRRGFEHCAYSWRVESERTYCGRQVEEHDQEKKLEEEIASLDDPEE